MPGPIQMKFNIVEIPKGSGRKYRYAYDPNSGRTIYLGPVGSTKVLNELDFEIWMQKKMSAAKRGEFAKMKKAHKDLPSIESIVEEETTDKELEDYARKLLDKDFKIIPGTQRYADPGKEMDQEVERVIIIGQVDEVYDGIRQTFVQAGFAWDNDEQIAEYVRKEALEHMGRLITDKANKLINMDPRFQWEANHGKEVWKLTHGEWYGDRWAYLSKEGRKAPKTDPKLKFAFAESGHIDVNEHGDEVTSSWEFGSY